MPVIFNRSRPRQTPSSNTFSQISRQASVAQQLQSHGYPRQTNRTDSVASKRTFHSINSTGGGGGGRSGSTLIRPASNATKLSVQDALQRTKDTLQNVPQTKFKKFKVAFKKFYKRRHIKYLVPLIAVMFYMLLGASVFYWLENEADAEQVRQRTNTYQRERSLLLKRMDEIVRDQAAESNEKRHDFLNEAIDHFHSQLGVTFTREPEWTFMTAMYFAGTVFTTIGYGDIACSTVAGRIATVIYGIVGIPIMLMTLNDLGKFLYKSINEFLDYCNTIKSKIRVFPKKQPPPPDIAIELGESTDDGLKIPNASRRVSFNLRNVSEEGTIDQLSLDLEVGGTQGELSEDAVFDDENDALELIPENQPIQNMPVSVALVITIGWIFLCAALFKIWEDWTYGESWYFMFISMSTIGLGDIAVKRRDIMVVCFIFVIIGLSLVSMCISVIQAALEDLYKRMLMKLLLDYQAKLSEGDHHGASMGMMKMWGKSKTAKYLLPMLSADTRRNVMSQIQEEAKDAGIELPPIFEDLDEKTGMPRILAVAEELKKADESGLAETYLENLVQQTDPTRISIPSRSPLPTVVYYEADTQTDIILLNDEGAQTEFYENCDSGIQTDVSESISIANQELQTDPVISKEEETQTPTVEYREAEVITTNPTYNNNEIQTDRIHMYDRQLQTQIVDFIENEMQTDIFEMVSELEQTDEAECSDKECQTDFAPSSSNGSRESLDWNPVDGLHAEKQKPVSDLKRMFDSFREEDRAKNNNVHGSTGSIKSGKKK